MNIKLRSRIFMHFNVKRNGIKIELKPIIKKNNEFI
jgi:hypothetical protein